jgi:ubiquitin-conjugating enzyme E2 J1
MEGSEAVRREFARESRGWVCRECGGSNEEVMKAWWGVCRERGVEVDVEGCEGFAKEEKMEEEEEEGGKKEDDGDGQSGTAPVDESASTPAPQVSTSTVSSEPPAPVSSGSSSTPTVVPSAPSTQSNIRPRPTPTSPAPAVAPPTMATRTAAATPSEPANSPWLDRAIIGIVFALIILITKRVVNVDDL